MNQGIDCIDNSSDLLELITESVSAQNGNHISVEAVPPVNLPFNASTA